MPLQRGILKSSNGHSHLCNKRPSSSVKNIIAFLTSGYTGSFLRHVFRTLEYAGEAFAHFMSAHDPIATDVRERKIDNIIHDPKTLDIVFYKSRGVQSYDSYSQIDSWVGNGIGVMSARAVMANRFVSNGIRTALVASWNQFRNPERTGGTRVAVS
jgi:hypothetical protein